MANEEQLEGFSWLESRYNHECLFHRSDQRGRHSAAGPGRVEDDCCPDRTAISQRRRKLSLRVTRPGLLGDLFGAPARGFLSGSWLLRESFCWQPARISAACSRRALRIDARELAIRMAIGSSRWRIVRQLLTEAFVIAIIGGAFACSLAWTALAGLKSWHPPTSFPIGFAVAPEPSLILVAFLISVFAGVSFGVIPLRQIFAADPNEALKSGSSHWPGGGRWAFRICCLAHKSPSAA